MTNSSRTVVHSTSIIQTETSVMLGHPARRPEALLAALRRELSARPGVTGAWLKLALRADEPSQTWMLGVETSGAWTDVQQALGRAIRLDDLEGKPLDAMQVGSSSTSDALRDGIPVLKRRSLLALLGL